MKKLFFLLACAVALTMSSCKPDPLPDDPIPDDPIPDTTIVSNDTIEPAFLLPKGVFVLNEGNFTFANASLTFYDPDMDTVTNNLFYRVNNPSTPMP